MSFPSYLINKKTLSCLKTKLSGATKYKWLIACYKFACLNIQQYSICISYNPLLYSINLNFLLLLLQTSYIKKYTLQSFTSVPVLSGIKLFFFTTASKGLYLGLVLETMVRIQGFCYCWAVLSQNKRVFLPTPPHQWAGDTQEVVRGHRQDSWPQLTQGVSHTIWCHAQHIKLREEEQRWDIQHLSFKVTILHDGALIPWRWPNTCLPIRRGELFCFACTHSFCFDCLYLNPFTHSIISPTSYRGSDWVAVWALVASRGQSTTSLVSFYVRCVAKKKGKRIKHSFVLPWGVAWYSGHKKNHHLIPSMLLAYLNNFLSILIIKDSSFQSKMARYYLSCSQNGMEELLKNQNNNLTF